MPRIDPEDFCEDPSGCEARGAPRLTPRALAHVRRGYAQAWLRTYVPAIFPSALLYCAGMLAGLLVRSRGLLAALVIVATTAAAIGYAVARGRR